MKLRRYNDFVALIASIAFGLAIGEFENLRKTFEGLIGNITTSITYASLVLTLIFLFIYARNIYGLMAYDFWADNRNYKPPYQLKSRHSFGGLTVCCLVALICPYTFVLFLKTPLKNGEFIDISNTSLWLFGILCFQELCYLIWDCCMLILLARKTDSVVCELKKYYRLWLVFNIIFFLFAGLIYFGLHKFCINNIFIWLVISSLVILLLLATMDLMINRAFYFSVYTSEDSSSTTTA